MASRILVHEAHGAQPKVGVIMKLTQRELAAVVGAVDQHAMASQPLSLPQSIERPERQARR